jgi:uncharacterized protein YegL
MNSDLTEIAFVLDRSGSMETMRAEAIGGFNHFLSEQKKEPGQVRFTLVLFDHLFEVPIDHKPLESVPPLNEETYFPRGSTALLDAMGRTIDTIGQRLANTPEDQRPSKVIIACMTDGFENASKHYSNEKVAAMIEHQRTTYSWEFVFLGATIESREMARSWTIAAADIEGFEATGPAVRHAMASSMARRVSSKRLK